MAEAGSGQLRLGGVRGGRVGGTRGGRVGVTFGGALGVTAATVLNATTRTGVAAWAEAAAPPSAAAMTRKDVLGFMGAFRKRQKVRNKVTPHGKSGQ